MTFDLIVRNAALPDGRKGLDIACPCMGNVLAVPLSTVTLTEDGVMVVMALSLLLAPVG